jgi:hypothetical protein
VLVPLPAIQSLENTTYAFVVKNNKATRSDINILADSGSYSAVSGLQDGDTVILNPPPGLLVGATVQTLQTTSAAPGAAPAGKKPAAPAGGGN